jgi:hypothetical protein
MSSLRARVKKGRIVLDEPTTLPEGTTLDLVVDDEGDEWTPGERKRLNHSIDKAGASAKAGKLRPADQVIAKLRSRG